MAAVIISAETWVYCQISEQPLAGLCAGKIAAILRALLDGNARDHQHHGTMVSKPASSFRTQIGRTVATLAGVVIVYLLGSGPAAYLWEHSEKSHGVVTILYDPLLHTVRGTPLEDVLADYQIWWTYLGRDEHTP